MNYHTLQNFNDSRKFVSCSGDRYHEDFVGKVDENGDVVLVSVGKTDIYQEIQSHALEADINVLIKRAQAGDLSVFKSAVFGDFTEMPQSYSEILNVVIGAEREFNHLPIDIKAKFDNDFHKYLATAGSKEWFTKVTGEEFKEDIKSSQAAAADPDEVKE